MVLVERGYPTKGVIVDTLRDAQKRDAKTFFFIQQVVDDVIFPKFQQQQIQKRHGMHSRMVIEEQYMSKEGQQIRHPINQQINKSTTQLTQCQAISTNPSFSTRFQHIQAFQQAFSNLSTLFPGFSHVFGKFLTVLFHSLVGKSNIFSINFSILIASFIQVYQVFKHNTVFIVKSNVYSNNFSILIASILQIYQLLAPCYFIYS